MARGMHAIIFEISAPTTEKLKLELILFPVNCLLELIGKYVHIQQSIWKGILENLLFKFVSLHFAVKSTFKLYRFATR